MVVSGRTFGGVDFRAVARHKARQNYMHRKQRMRSKRVSRASIWNFEKVLLLQTLYR